MWRWTWLRDCRSVFWGIIFLFVIGVFRLNAEPFPALSDVPKEKWIYSIRENTQIDPSAEMTSVVEKTNIGSREFARQHQHITYFKTQNQELFEDVMEIKNGYMTALYSLHMIINGASRQLLSEEIIFNHSEKTARVIRDYNDSTDETDLGFNDKIDTVIPHITAETYSRMMLRLGCRMLPMELGYSGNFRVITRGGKLFLIKVRIPEITEINVAGKSLISFHVMKKLVMPQAPLRVFPNMNAWYSTSSPHQFISYEGPWMIPAKITQVKAFLAPSIVVTLKEVVAAPPGPAAGFPFLLDKLKSHSLVQ